MQTVAMVAGPCQRAAAAPTSRRGPAAACLAPLRGAASSHAAPQRRQPAAQAARSSWGSSGWRQRRCWALAAVPEPEFHPVDQEKLDKFKELNKDYAVVTQQIEARAHAICMRGCSRTPAGLPGG